jgi:SAM-dependent methyltransferase
VVENPVNTGPDLKNVSSFNNRAKFDKDLKRKEEEGTKINDELQIEFHIDNYDKHKKKFEYKETFIKNLAFEENTFDVVFCNHVLEHVKDDVQCMQEIRRVLKPTGFALCQSPQRYDLPTTYEDASITDPREREIHFLQDDHLRIYGRDYGTQLEKSGFKVEPVNLIEKLGLPESNRMALPLEEIIYVCRK